MMIPEPNAIASHGTSRPGATSAAAHSRRRCTARCAKLASGCGYARVGLRPAAIQGRHASARPRDLPCSITARSTPTASYRHIVHAAGGHGMGLVRHPQRSRSLNCGAIPTSARAVEAPFYHLQLERVFPDDVYASMLAAMPQASDYRPLYGQNQCNVLEDGTHTRVKIDLFPEYIRHLPPEKRVVWDIVGRALCSEAVKAAFMRGLAPALARRFGPDYAKVGMYPIAILTRDVPGYKIDPHTDTRWKGITVQLFLPRDASHTDIGTIFHEKLPDGSLPKRTQIKFAPNTGYAFAVGEDTWHSADRVGPKVTTRDSILHTYFVDAGLLRVLRNRGKRIGNFLRNELRHYAPR